MIQYPPVHSLREAGFKLCFSDHALGPDEQWLVVGTWNSGDVSQNINATIQIEQLRATFGPRRCAELQDGMFRVIAAEDSDDINTLLREQLERYEEEGMIDDCEFWNQLAPLVEETWADMDASSRIDLIRHSGETPDLLFAATIPPVFFSEVASWVTAN